jgi:hypothetical protein
MHPGKRLPVEVGLVGEMGHTMSHNRRPLANVNCPTSGAPSLAY